MIKLLLALGTTLAAAGAPSHQFDLVCDGTLKSESLFETKTEPYHSVYRIDLDRGKFCDGECGALHEIAEIQPVEIVLQRDEVDTRSERSTLNDSVNRRTGDHHVTATWSDPRDRASRIVMTWNGHCASKPFSGFPDFETLF